MSEGIKLEISLSQVFSPLVYWLKAGERRSIHRLSLTKGFSYIGKTVVLFLHIAHGYGDIIKAVPREKTESA